ncbi:aspartic peptidase domain-containing protein [Mycena galericulata]|nr:aspartic peptidase domain-containing protein [Mycena galericulata]
MYDFPDTFTVKLTIPILDLFGQLQDVRPFIIRFRYQSQRATYESSVPPRSVQQLQDLPQTGTTTHNNISHVGISDTSEAQRFFAPQGPSSVAVHSGKGPAPALPEDDRSYDQWLASRVRTDAVGFYAQVLASWDRSIREFFAISTAINWIYGVESKNGVDCPRGTALSRARFWSYITGSTNRSCGPTEHKTSYADSSHVYFKLVTDYVSFNAHDPPPTTEPNRPWLSLTFGVAHSVSRHFEFFPASGILGLGRAMLDFWDYPNQANECLQSFLQQIRDDLKSPEMTVMLAIGQGAITFGPRVRYTVPDGLVAGPWHNNITVIGESHWIVSSTKKKLNGREYTYENGTALIDTGAAFIYTDPTFTQHVYDCIPGSLYRVQSNERFPREIGHFYIPLDAQKFPNIQFDIGGGLFTLEHFFLPSQLADAGEIDGKPYIMGAIQSTNVLYPEDDQPHNGPDLIGRVALMNMELVLQFPSNKPHTVSWRRKETQLLSPI